MNEATRPERNEWIQKPRNQADGTRHIQGLGTCTWMFGPMPLAEIAARVKAIGLDGVELLGDLSLYSAREAAHILEDQGLSVFSLTPTDADPAHPDPAVRAQAVDYFLRLLDFAAELGRPPEAYSGPPEEGREYSASGPPEGGGGYPASGPLVCCHGLVGRVRAIDSQEAERAAFVEATRQIAQRAESLGLRVVMEVLNRYEAHLLNTAAEAVQFVADVGSPNLGILLDAYHMNIEEGQPADALRQAGDRLWLYHAADSNRQAIGRGHTDFGAQMVALADVGYRGPIILECTAPGPNPFAPIKDERSLDWLETYLRESRAWLLGF